MEPLIAIFDFLFGCHHRRLSRVFTIGGRTYRVCCECGAKFKYSLADMSTGERFVEPPFVWSFGQDNVHSYPREIAERGARGKEIRSLA